MISISFMVISHGRLTNMPRKNISVKSDEVKEEQIVELLKILIKNSEEIKEILLQLKNRFI